MSFIKQKAKENLKWAVNHRRFLHKYPELSMQEKNTSLYCRHVMQSLGYKIKNSWGYGFIADLDIGAKKTIAWRSEMDALSIQEKNEYPFISTVPGIAHMCGHDIHMAIAFLIAKLVAENKNKLNCNVRFLFQPSEEIPPGGALGMIENGCLNDVNEVYALHNDVFISTGQIKVKVGAITSCTTNFDLIIKGKGTHAATPHNGLDPLCAAANIVSLWQSIISRKLDPTHSAVLSVTKFICGKPYNVIADEAKLGGTIRSFDIKDTNAIIRIMRTHLEPLRIQGYKCDFSFDKTYDSTINSKYGVERVIDSSYKVIEKKDVITDFSPAVCGEDFGKYLEKKPGAMFFLGARKDNKKLVSHHSATFDPDEKCIMIGSSIGAELFMNS